ncbi:hypothetical protein QN277_004419 [Acacia crassicarpa]|uniref:Legume lectin domain-containing protein n=1 Tax=Acacia crassicarpa TaxID=499986 RepID=A0AAE1J3L8_9FABA|nr:hypothetical protein QN277_004419 [Acacia crassicarpa]
MAITKTQIPMSGLLILAFFLVLAHNVNSASFKFDNFSSSSTLNAITLQGDSFITSNNALQLTNALPNRAGRGSYSEPVHIWDAQTGKLAWFTTTFSFVMSPASPGPLGDGFSFFLAPFKSNIPQNSFGGYLGLFDPKAALNSFKNQIVAVEFDTFGDSWDPVFQHVGIDINSIASVSTVALPSVNVQSGLIGFATVNYEPNEKNLSVILTYPQSQVSVTTASLSFTVDLRTILPEWVRVGFSASTGQVVELHKILTWSFSSSFN